MCTKAEKHLDIEHQGTVYQGWIKPRLGQKQVIYHLNGDLPLQLRPVLGLNIKSIKDEYMHCIALLKRYCIYDSLLK